jgi:hypothetical protein
VSSLRTRLPIKRVLFAIGLFWRLAFGWLLTVSWGTVVQFLSLRHALSTGNYEIVQGRIDHYEALLAEPEMNGLR